MSTVKSFVVTEEFRIPYFMSPTLKSNIRYYTEVLRNKKDDDCGNTCIEVVVMKER